MKTQPFKKLAHKMIQSAIEAVDPYKLIRNEVRLEDEILSFKRVKTNLALFKNIYVLGIGKAAGPMAAAFEDILGPRLSAGAVIVKYGHTVPLRKIKLYEAGHPVPDENSLNATQHLLKIAERATEKDLILFVISGGGSALFERLPASIPPEHLATFNERLLSCGASIDEINVLRKHISLVKGGRFAEIASPARLETFILSDVIGDAPENIASGPTAPDSSTFKDVRDILNRYRLTESLPVTILDYFKRGLEGREPETPKAENALFKKVHNRVVGNNRLALENARKIAERAGYKTQLIRDPFQGDVHEVANFWAEKITELLKKKQTEAGKICILGGGEPTVTLKGKGLGGRNQELALLVLSRLKEASSPFYFCSVGTDGSDGPTDAAGAWIDQESFSISKKAGLNINDFMERNDSYHFFEQTGCLIKTGPTGTNVMDVMFCLI